MGIVIIPQKAIIWEMNSANYYLYIPSPEERGGLTAREILFAQMPCYFGSNGTVGKLPYS